MDRLAQSGLVPIHTPRATESFRELLQSGGVNGREWWNTRPRRIRHCQFSDRFHDQNMNK